MARSKFQKKKHKKHLKFKSGLEAEFARKAFAAGIACEYEPDRFPYQIVSHYTPDFKLSKTYYVETKGYFSPSNRGRLLSFREQYPKITIHLVFQEPNNKLSKLSKTTYAQWADKHGFPWSDIRKIDGKTFSHSGCAV